jgi:hypothetical protein
MAAGALAALAIAGCSGTEVIQPNVNVSMGQQLIDLKKARDTGALSESDYQRQKQGLIDDAR